MMGYHVIIILVFQNRETTILHLVRTLCLYLGGRINTAHYFGREDVVQRHATDWCAAYANMYKCKRDESDPWMCIREGASTCMLTMGRIQWDFRMNEGWRLWRLTGKRTPLTFLMSLPMFLKR